MTEFKIIVNFLFDNTESASWVSQIKEYIDTTETDVEYSQYPVHDDDQIVLSGIEIMLVLEAVPPVCQIYDSDRSVLDGRIVIDHLRDDEPSLNPFLELIKIAYLAAGPVYVFGMPSYRVETIGVDIPGTETPAPVSKSGLADNRIDHPTTLMVFPQRWWADTGGRNYSHYLHSG